MKLISLEQKLTYHLDQVKTIRELIRDTKVKAKRVRLMGTGYQKFNQVLKVKGIAPHRIHRDRLSNGNLSVKIGGRPLDKELAKFADSVKVYQSHSYAYGENHPTARYIFKNVPRRGSK